MAVDPRSAYKITRFRSTMDASCDFLPPLFGGALGRQCEPKKRPKWAHLDSLTWFCVILVYNSNSDWESSENNYRNIRMSDTNHIRLQQGPKGSCWLTHIWYASQFDVKKLICKVCYSACQKRATGLSVPAKRNTHWLSKCKATGAEWLQECLHQLATESQRVFDIQCFRSRVWCCCYVQGLVWLVTRHCRRIKPIHRCHPHEWAYSRTLVCSRSHSALTKKIMYVKG